MTPDTKHPDALARYWAARRAEPRAGILAQGRIAVQYLLDTGRVTQDEVRRKWRFDHALDVYAAQRECEKARWADGDRTVDSRLGLAATRSTHGVR